MGEEDNTFDVNVRVFKATNSFPTHFPLVCSSFSPDLFLFSLLLTVLSHSLQRDFDRTNGFGARFRTRARLKSRFVMTTPILRALETSGFVCRFVGLFSWFL
ncbi:unnamed protein product [Citrullus colocynthis]|uniref:Uncharacterized protein n=1 Tax=Citrullus colocynthis TaxID=252529 RepID=A0ABP0Z0P0_9ROSI